MSALEKLSYLLNLILDALQHGLIDYQVAKKKQEEAMVEYQRALLDLRHSLDKSP